MNKPNKWIYILSFLPGLGHFYLELMNRGLQLMLLFFGGIFLSMQFFEAAVIFLPVIVFYGYYDALKHYHIILKTGERHDEPIIQWSFFNGREYIIGWGLIIVGIFAFLQIIESFLPYSIQNIMPYQFFEKLFLALIFIGLGSKLLLGKKDAEVPK